MAGITGVLALQGDFHKHMTALAAVRAAAREVRTAADLNGLARLIIPGGESTTMTLLLDTGLRDPLREFCRTHPAWGTCAGMIMLAATADDPRVRPLGLMDIVVDRNGFGRQVHSFEADLRVAVELGEPQHCLRGLFIRAPRLLGWGEEVRPLAWLDSEPVCVRQGHWLASSFHPELTADMRLPEYFLAMSA